jgi:polyisoprenoid-binding protein YceI
MEEHFNENYMESEKYPKSEFKGKILNIETYDFSNTSPFEITVQGNLTVHGITKPKKMTVTIKNKEQVIIAETKFQINLADHNIQRPQILWEKLSENIAVTGNFNYILYK